MPIRTGIFKSEVAQTVPFNNSSNGFAATNVQSAIEEAKNLSSIVNTYLTSSTTVSTSSSTFQNISGVSVTPAAGTYIIIFNASAETDGVNTESNISLFIGGVEATSARREIRATTNIIGLITLSTCNLAAPTAIVLKATLNGSQIIEPRMRTVSGGATYCNERTLTLLRIGS